MYSSQNNEAPVFENSHVISYQTETKSTGLAYVVFGWIFFAISLLFIPILFGAAAFFMGLMTFWERSQFHGAVLMGFAFLGTLFGSLLSFVVAGTYFI